MRQHLLVAVAVLLAGCAAGALGTMSPEAVERFVGRHWRLPLAPQGAPPATFSPLEASLAPESCGSCHPVQLADWRTSVHAAALGPGVAGQLADMLERDPEAALACQNCHAPLAEQRPLVQDAAARSLKKKGDAVASSLKDMGGPEMAPQTPPRVTDARAPSALVPNPVFDAALRPRGLVCAGCHVRGHERFAPPKRDGSLVSAAARETLPHRGATRTPAFERSEFCRDCHQFRPDGFALNGKPLENTYEEWRASRFARAGVQCQDCHMPDRRHLWRGIHDPAMVRSGLGITLVREAAPGVVAATLRVENTGVGHAFPTYVTPLVVLRAELLDAGGRVQPGSREEHVIGRQVELDLSRELTDTRLFPGERAELHYRRPHAPGTRARFSVIVYPDAFYTAFFTALLTQAPGPGRAQIEQALTATRRSWFTVFAEEIPAG
jgi:cytochrome c554/c'-like protein